MDAAGRVFVAQGVADTPLSEVAKEAGVTKSLIHHHFGSKEELWTEVKRTNFKRYFEPILQTIRSDKPSLDALREVIIHMFTFLRDNPDIARMMGWIALEQDATNEELEDAVCNEGLRRIGDGQAKGTLRSDVHPASIMSVFIILTSHWWHFRHVAARWKGTEEAPLPDADALDDQFFKDMMTIFMEGVTPR